jgi:hypothetical protein
MRLLNMFSFISHVPLKFDLSDRTVRLGIFISSFLPTSILEYQEEEYGKTETGV